MFKHLLLVSAVALFAMAGCGGGNDAANNPPKLKVKDPKLVDVPAMMRGLSGRDPKGRIWAAFLLGEAGPRAAEAIPALEKMAAGPEGPEQKAAAEALEKIKNPQPAGDEAG